MPVFLTKHKGKSLKGPDINFLTWKLAEDWCNGFAPHLKVTGQLYHREECTGDSFEPPKEVWEKAFENYRANKN